MVARWVLIVGRRGGGGVRGDGREEVLCGARCVCVRICGIVSV